MNDWDLIKDYAATGSEEAFAELVRRYVDLVYSAALRQVGGDAHLAQDVTQCVFNDLARKAGSLSSRVVLSGWLYTGARFAAAKLVRAEQRRRIRESHAQIMQESSDADSTPDWDQLQTVLDETMHDLKEADRNAILLRHFHGKNFNEVGKAIGVSEDGARMRVDRAVEKLRGLLRKRGVATSAGALAVILAQQSISAAPVGLAASVAASAVGAAATTGAAVGIFQFMAMTKIQAGVIAIAIAGLTVPVVLQYRANQNLERSNEILRRRSAEAVAEVEPLKQELARLNTQLNTRPKSAEASNEIFQLRAEVARLREEARTGVRTRAIVSATQGNDPVQDTLRTLGLRAEQLKKRLGQMPESQIPELALIDEKDWLDAAANVEGLETDEDYRRALNTLRARAKQKAGSELQGALRKFAEANNDALPTSVAQLQPYLEKSLDPAVLPRWQISYAGKYSEAPAEQNLIEEIAPPVDPEFETKFTFRRNGASSHSYNSVSDAIEAAAIAFAQANNGVLPRSSEQLAGLVPAQISNDRVQKFLKEIPPNITTLDQMRSQKR